jgi:uncharacterized protein (TIGR03437 family)
MPALPFLLLAQALLIEDGYASLQRTPGATVHVFAQQNTNGRVFHSWSGDSHLLLDPQAPYTTLTMPGVDVSLKANYRTVPAWTARSTTLANIPVTHYIPPNPVGLVFFFHGTGGSGAGQFTGAEFLSFIRDLTGAGFGVAAFDCLNRDTGQWNTTVAGAANPDIVRVNSVIAALRGQGLIPANLPLFAFGHSNGGQFAHHSAPELKWTAVSISAVQGSNPATAAFDGPMLWWMPANDDHPQVGQVNGIQTSIGRYELVANRNIFARHTITRAMPLYPERFTRSAILTLADSQELYTLFRSRGWLDANDFLTRNPNTFDWRSALPARFTENQRLSINVQLEATYMTHEFANYAPHLTIDLFLRAIGSRPALRPINAASYLGSSIAPGSIATLFANGIAPALAVPESGPANTLLGVSAVLRSATGTETAAPWFFVSPSQASFLAPAALAPGEYSLRLRSADRRLNVPTRLVAAAPGIFTANGAGTGAPAAVLLRVAPDGTRSTELTSGPIRFGPDRLFLDLYATGVRGGAAITVLAGEERISPLYAGPQPQFAGLDQVTFEIPPAWATRDRVSLLVVSGTERSNTVELLFGN